MACLLRERMTQEIKGYGAFDLYFRRGDGIAAKYNDDLENGYEKYLNEMDAASFLSTYNRLNNTINNLD